MTYSPWMPCVSSVSVSIQAMHSCYLFRQFIHAIYSGYSFMLSIQAIHSCYLYRQFIHAIYSGNSFMLSIQAIHSCYLFRLFIQAVYSGYPFRTHKLRVQAIFCVFSIFVQGIPPKTYYLTLGPEF